MNEAKLTRMEGALNGIARKVLEAVPVQSPWTKDQIMSEMRRQGSGAERNVVEGCLDTLRGRGLIKEPARGAFLRVVSKPAIPTPPEKDAVPATQPTIRAAITVPPEKKDPLTRFADVAKLLRQAADELDAAALDAAEEVQAAAKDTERFRQLQSLLKGI